MNDDFSKAKTILETIKECGEYHDFEGAAPLIQELRDRMNKYERTTDTNYIYFNGKLSTAESYLSDILAPVGQKDWKFSDAYRYFTDSLCLVEYGLGLMENYLFPEKRLYHTQSKLTV